MLIVEQNFSTIRLKPIFLDGVSQKLLELQILIFLIFFFFLLLLTSSTTSILRRAYVFNQQICIMLWVLLELLFRLYRVYRSMTCTTWYHKCESFITFLYFSNKYPILSNKAELSLFLECYENCVHRRLNYNTS